MVAILPPPPPLYKYVYYYTCGAQFAVRAAAPPLLHFRDELQGFEFAVAAAPPLLHFRDELQGFEFAVAAAPEAAALHFRDELQGFEFAVAAADMSSSPLQRYSKAMNLQWQLQLLFSTTEMNSKALNLQWYVYKLHLPSPVLSCEYEL